MKRRDIEIEEGLGELSWGPTKVTMLLDRGHVAALKRISELTRVSRSKLYAQALDDFLKKVGWHDEPISAPTDVEFIVKKIVQSREVEEQK